MRGLLYVGGLVLLGGLSLAQPASARDEVGVCEAVRVKLDPNGDGAFADGDNPAALIAAGTCPTPGEISTSRSYVLRRMGRADEARAEVARAIALDPDNPFAQRVSCTLLMDRGDLVTARAACERAVALKPNWNLGLQTRADLNLRDKRFDAAISDFTAAIALRPDNALAYILRAQGYETAGRKAEALADFQIAAKLDPRDEIAPRGAGRMLYGLKRNPEALTALNAAVANKPTIFGLILRGQVYEALKQPALALADYDRAIALDPKSAAEAYDGKGWILRDRDDRAGALASFDAAVAAAPAWPVGWNDRGLQKFVMGDVAGSVADYSKAIALSPARATYYVNRAKSYAWLRQFDLAEADAIKAGNLEPNNGQAWDQLGQALLAQMATKDPFPVINKYLAVNPKNQTLLFWRARLYGDSEKYSEAEADYSALLTINPNYKWAYMNRGLARERLGRPSQASADYFVFLQLEPSYDLAWFKWYTTLLLGGQTPAYAQSQVDRLGNTFDAYRGVWLARSTIRSDQKDLAGAQDQIAMGLKRLPNDEDLLRVASRQNQALRNQVSASTPSARGVTPPPAPRPTPIKPAVLPAPPRAPVQTGDPMTMMQGDWRDPNTGLAFRIEGAQGIITALPTDKVTAMGFTGMKVGVSDIRFTASRRVVGGSEFTGIATCYIGAGTNGVYADRNCPVSFQVNDNGFQTFVGHLRGSRQR